MAKRSSGSVHATGKAANALFAALSMTPEQREAADLQASAMACAVADAWATNGHIGAGGVYRDGPPFFRPDGSVPTDLLVALDQLELATRSSPLRKVTR